MATLNDSLILEAPLLLDARSGPYVDLATAQSSISSHQRQKGLIVIILDGSSNSQLYWFRDGVADEDLIEFTVGNSQILSGLDAAKIADGSVSNTEYQYLDGAQSNLQAQIDAKADGGFVNFDAVPQTSSITATGSKDFVTDNGKVFPVDATSGAITITLNTLTASKTVGFYRTDVSSNDVSIILSSGSIVPTSTVKLGQSEIVYITGVNDSGATLKAVSYTNYLYAHPYMKTSLRKTTAGDARYYFGVPEYVNTGTFDFDSSSYQIDGFWITDTTTSNTPDGLGGNYWYLRTILAGSNYIQIATKVDGKYPIMLQRHYDGSTLSDWYYVNGFFSGVNDTGVQINAGEVCRVYYDSATDNRWEIIEAEANNSTNVDGVIGFLMSNTADEAQGVVMTKGLIGSLNTSSMTIGDIVYLSDSSEGVITTTKPTTPGSFVVELGTVKTVHATTGEIYVDVKQPISVYASRVHDATTAVQAEEGFSVTFDVSTGTPSISTSNNVSSITDNEVGGYTINLTTALSSADIELHAVTRHHTGTSVQGVVALNAEPTTSAIDIFVSDGSGNLFDPTYISVSGRVI